MGIDEDRLATSDINSPDKIIRSLQELLAFFREELEYLMTVYAPHVRHLNEGSLPFEVVAPCFGIMGSLHDAVHRSQAILTVVAREFPGQPHEGPDKRQET